MDKISQDTVMSSDLVRRKPLSVRLLHWFVALLFLIAFVTGETAFRFDLDMRIRTRDALFATHRLSGMLAAILLLMWGAIRVSGALTAPRELLRNLALKIFHLTLWLTAVITPLLPWIARSLDGRTQELYSLFPVFNLVSHPTTLWTYWLLAHHKMMSSLILYIIAAHVIGALFHWGIKRDSVLPSMWFD